MREYSLIPSDRIRNDIVTLTTDPRETEQMNNTQEQFRKDVSNVKETLTPEIQLKLLSYFKKHLEKKLNSESKSCINKNELVNKPIEKINTNETRTGIIDKYISVLPKQSRKLGNTLAQYLSTLNNIDIDETGFLSKNGSFEKVHVRDIVKTLTTANYLVSNEICLFIQDINIPDVFIRNKLLKLKKDIKQIAGSSKKEN